jgi:hypothetical protein
METLKTCLEAVDDRAVATVGVPLGTLSSPVLPWPGTVARPQGNAANELLFVVASNAIRHVIRGGHAMMLVPGLEARGRVDLRPKSASRIRFPASKTRIAKPLRSVIQCEG